MIDKRLAGSAYRIFSRSKFYARYLRDIGVIAKRYETDVRDDGLHGRVEIGKKSN
jgi:hypothetical protein